MADGVAGPPPPSEEQDRGEGAAAGMWSRRIGLGLILAVILIVLLAGVVGDLLPGSGTPVGSPAPIPTLTVPGVPGTTSAPVPSASSTAPPTASGTGSGGNPGSGTNDGGGDNPDAGSTKPPPIRPTVRPTPTPTRTPTPTPTPTLPRVGPDHCIADFGNFNTGSCNTRQLLVAQIRSGRLALTNAVGLTSVSGSNASVIPLRMGQAEFGSPGLGGQIRSVIVADARGTSEGWSLTGTLALPGGIPPGVVMSIDPWCKPLSSSSARGIHAGAADQLLEEPVTLCEKDNTVGGNGSSGGVYQVGGLVSVAAWRGTTVPTSDLILTLSLA